MTGSPALRSEQEFADRVAELVYSSTGGDFAELWTGRWTTVAGRPVLITVGRAEYTKYFAALGHDISPYGWLGWLYADLSLASYETICEPNPWKYQRGLVLIGGEHADTLNAAWQDDLALSDSGVHSHAGSEQRPHLALSAGRDAILAG